MTIDYRRALPRDREFVISTWSSSYKDSHSAGMITDEDWPSVMHVQIGKTIDRPDCTVIVACDSTARDHIADLYGFIAADSSVPLVWYVYVKSAYRRLGIARGLYAAAGIDPAAAHSWACKTAVAAHLAKPVNEGGAGKIPHARFDPKLGRIQKQDVVPLELRRGRIRRRRAAVVITILRKETRDGE